MYISFSIIFNEIVMDLLMTVVLLMKLAECPAFPGIYLY